MPLANKIYEVHLLNMLIKSRVTTQQGLASEEEETIKWQKKYQPAWNAGQEKPSLGKAN